MELGCDYGNYKQAKVLQQLCKNVLRKYHGLFTDYYDIARSDTVKLWLHYNVNEIHTVVQLFYDGIYGYDTVWSAKHIY